MLPYHIIYFRKVSVTLSQIAYIYLHPPTLTVPHREVKPENVASCVGIYPQKQVVLVGSHLYHAIQISTFEPRLKKQLFLQLQSGVHPFKGPIIDLIFVVLIMIHRILTLRRIYLEKTAVFIHFLFVKFVTPKSRVLFMEHNRVLPMRAEVANAILMA